MLKRLRNLFAAAQPRPARLMHVPLRVRGRYDAAATTDENRRHWANADHFSVNAANSPAVRRVLRARSRYEVANNAYARGITLTIANDVVGTGPRLQLLTDDPTANRRVEQAFAQWADAVGLPEHLRTMRASRCESGEVFAILTQNPRLDTPVNLDLRLVEADQVATPAADRTTTTDGILYDRFGNPTEYHVLRNHPGDGAGALAGNYDRLPAASVIHYFRVDRPGQLRGIPEITPALSLFAQLRRYTLAVIAAAETAADFAAVLYTDAPANGEADPVEPMDLVDLERRMATVLPGGWKLGQITAEQPATTYGEFKKEILNEIARCLNMPFNVAAGNSSGYNYASGRLDHQTYYKSIRVDQSHMGRVVLDAILRAWLDEAALVEGLLPQSLRQRGTLPEHQWFWDGQEHVDPAKEAGAQATRLQNNTTTLAYEYARQGRDWESEIRQRAKELQLMQSLGINTAIPGASAPSTPSTDPEESNDDESADESSGCTATDNARASEGARHARLA